MKAEMAEQRVRKFVVGASRIFGIAACLALSSCSSEPEEAADENSESVVVDQDAASPSTPRVPIVDDETSFTCTPTHVWDGDGPIWCAEGARIRLAGIAAREMDGSCNDNQPCPDASAVQARDALVRLVGVPTGVSEHGHITVEGPSLSCISTGSAGGSRTGAWCVSPNYGDISCALIEEGVVLRWEQYWEDGHCN